MAWEDDGGVKVAGSPSSAADPCVMGSTPIVLSPTATHPSIGGADVAAFLPKPPSPPAVPPGPAAPVATVPHALVVKLPAKLKTKALVASRGVAVKVRVGGPGKVSIRGTVAARRLGRRGKPVLVATGNARRASRRHGDDPAATHHSRPQARPPAHGRAAHPADHAGLRERGESGQAAITRLQPQSLVKRPRRQILSFAPRGNSFYGLAIGFRWWWGPVPLGPCRAKH